jgi:hypothetical protein
MVIYPCSLGETSEIKCSRPIQHKESFVIRILAVCFLLLASAAGGEEPRFVEGTDVFELQHAPKCVLADGTITLRNRGRAVVTENCPDGAIVKFDWKWTEGDLEKKYPDHLCVALLTDNLHRKKWSHELAHGVVVRFNPGSGGVGIEGWLPDKDEGDSLAFKDGFTFEKGKEYAIVVSYTPEKVSVTVDRGEPIVAVIPVKYRSGARLGVYNREPVAGIVKESVLTKVSVDKVKR